ncbi:MAG: hypothetical protein WDM85_15520 [Caulobacteraceae bacterium]
MSCRGPRRPAAPSGPPGRSPRRYEDALRLARHDPERRFFRRRLAQIGGVSAHRLTRPACHA